MEEGTVLLALANSKEMLRTGQSFLGLLVDIH